MSTRRNPEQSPAPDKKRWRRIIGALGLGKTRERRIDEIPGFTREDADMFDEARKFYAYKVIVTYAPEDPPEECDRMSR